MIVKWNQVANKIKGKKMLRWVLSFIRWGHIRLTWSAFPTLHIHLTRKHNAFPTLHIHLTRKHNRHINHPHRHCNRETV